MLKVLSQPVTNPTVSIKASFWPLVTQWSDVSMLYKEEKIHVVIDN